ncbi:MAG: S-layer homology domain-containing protein [bacterium]|nr:S-layer homology domain-containing protein [bacterium]MDE0601392.1 S-layer homology domain-containing protein [bacterium]
MSVLLSYGFNGAYCTSSGGDVPETHPANQAIGWAASYSINSGVGEGRFDLDGTVTRAQIVTFPHRTANLLENR